MIQHGMGNAVTCEGEPADRDAWKSMELRAERNHKLAETDWWGSSDKTMTEGQKTYRQSLRDMDFSDPFNLTWPKKPEG